MDYDITALLFGETEVIFDAIFFWCQDSTHDKGLIQEPVMVMGPDGYFLVPNLWQ